MTVVHNANKRTFTSPAGSAKFPHLNTPDTKFDDDGVYKVDLAMDAESAEAKELIEILDSYVEDAFTAMADELKPAQIKKAEGYAPYLYEEDDEGEATGRVLFRFKAQARFKDRKTGQLQNRTITMFDAAGGKPLRNPPIVRMESVLKVAAVVGRPWYNATAKQIGISCYIQAVQILELSEGRGGRADNFGFGDDSDQYSGVGESEGQEAGFDDEGEGYETAQPEPGEGDF